MRIVFCALRISPSGPGTFALSEWSMICLALHFRGQCVIRPSCRQIAGVSFRCRYSSSATLNWRVIQPQGYHTAQSRGASWRVRWMAAPPHDRPHERRVVVVEVADGDFLEDGQRRWVLLMSARRAATWFSGPVAACLGSARLLRPRGTI